MAYEGGGKIKNKRGAEAPKPYSRNTSLMGRVKESVKEMLAPSWLVDLVSSVKKKTPPNSPPQYEIDEDTEEPNHVNINSINIPPPQQQQQPPDRFMSSSSMPSHLTQRPIPVHTTPSSHSAAESTPFSVDRSPYAQFNKMPALSNSVVMNGEDNQDMNEFSLMPGPEKSDYQRNLIHLNDNKIAQLRKEFAGSVTPSKELEAQQQSTSNNETARDDKADNSNSFLWTTEVKAKTANKPQPAAKTSKASFNASLFGSSIVSPERSSLFGGSSSMHESSYYPGKTQFGGASSVKQRARSRAASPYLSGGPARKQMKAKALKTSSTAVTSSTARKILDTLESMSTPLNDAKKIPSYSSAMESPLSFTPSSYRRRSLPARALGPNLDGPPVRGLQTPGMASISENLRRPPIHALPKPSLPPKSAVPSTSSSIQQSSSMAGESSSGRMGKMKRDRGGGHYSRKGQEEVEEVEEAPVLPTGFTLPVSNFSGFSLPVPAVSPVQGKPPSQDASSPLAAAAGFKFSSPIAKADPSPHSPDQHSPPATFKFSSPLTMSTASTTTASSSNVFASSSSSSLSSGSAFGSHSSTTFSSGSATASSSASSGSGASAFSFGAPKTVSSGGLSFGSTAGLKMKAQSPTPASSTAPLSAGSVMDVLGKTASPQSASSQLKQGSCLQVLGLTGNKKTEDSGTKSEVPLSELFKSQSNMWECSMCMIKNKPEVEKCVACETPKPSKPPASLPAVSAPLQAGVKPLTDLFKKPPGQWDCPTCMIQNKAEVEKCVACDTAKPQSKDSQQKPQETIPPLQAGVKPLTDLFKKPPGQWDCPTCMIQNKAETEKCVACETANPQAKAPVQQKPVDSGFGSKASTPAASTTSSSTGPSLAAMFKKPEGSWECDTCMVQNKPGLLKCIACETPKPGAPKPTSNFTSSGGFKFGSSGGFQFGAAANNNNKDKDSSDKPTTNGEQSFKFGSTNSGESKSSSTSTFGNGIKFGSTSGDSKNDGNAGPVGFSFGGKTLTDSNKEGSSAAPTGFSFGGKSIATTDSKKDDAAPAFAFGKPASTTDSNKKEASVAPAGFKFGASKDDAKDTSSTATGIKFGAGSSEANSTLGDVKFGSADSKASDTSSGATKTSASVAAFSFGGNSSSGASTVTTTTTAATSDTKPATTAPFAFGAAKPDSSKTDKAPATSAAPASSLFEFGKTPLVAGSTDEKKALGAFQFKAPATSATPEASKADSSKPAFGTGNFSFGTSKAEEKKEATPATSGVFGTPGFSFSAPSASTSSAAGSSSGPLFGSAATKPSEGSSTPFAFGQKRSSDQDEVGGKRPRETESSSKPFSNGEQSSSVFGSSTPFASASGTSSFGSGAFSASSASSGNGQNTSSSNVFGATAATSVPAVFQFGTNSASDNKAAGSTPFQFNAAPAAQPFNFGATAAAPAASFNFSAGSNPAPSAAAGNATFQFNAGGSSNPFNAIASSGATRRPMKKAVRKIKK